MTRPIKQTQNTNLPGRGPGWPKGSQNNVTVLLKEAILEAGKNAGERDLVAYLEKQARENPGPFLALLGKVLPWQVSGDQDNPANVPIQTIELVARKPD